jgi:hypothetical protein
MAIVRAGRIRSIEKKIHLIGTRNRYLQACGIVPQPTTLPVKLLVVLLFQSTFLILKQKNLDLRDHHICVSVCVNPHKLSNV